MAVPVGDAVKVCAAGIGTDPAAALSTERPLGRSRIPYGDKSAFSEGYAVKVASSATSIGPASGGSIRRPEGLPGGSYRYKTAVSVGDSVKRDT
jgi:hypothetical protein